MSMIRPSLDELGLKNQTDKSSSTHDYLNTYEKYLEGWRFKKFTLLEIGVAGGGSIKTWREYFITAKVYGIDINPDCAGEGIFIGNATDPEFMLRVMNEIGNPDIIIDDGGHVGEETIKTFQMMFNFVKSGGYYIVEDTATFYNNHYSGDFQSNGRTRPFNFFTDLACDVDVCGRAMCGKQETAINWAMPDPPVPMYSRLLKAIHIHPGLWIYERK